MARVLVVDDALFMRASIKKLLEANGHIMVGEAANGYEAIEQYEEYKPDIVILDITMPEMDGIEALKRIRSYDRYAKVVICSAIGQQVMIAEAIKSGASEFIVKPFEPEHLLAAVKKVLGKKK